jgi:3-methyladenine DNA glycosylase AlkC
MTTEYGLKRHFTEDAARLLGSMLQQVHPQFDTDGYVAETRRRVSGKELKERVLVLTEGMRDRLPDDYVDAVPLLLAILGDELGEGDGMFTTSWFLMPVARYVEEYGLDHPQLSLDALEAITRRHTAEYAIRPFLERHYEPTMARIYQWAVDPSHNVRRLASEGIRPRLPWARTLTRFVVDPAPVLDVLERLRSDGSPYVRRSVANNLNDISKDNRDVALTTAQRWVRESRTPETTWIVTHGLRTLVRRGDRDALTVLGATGGEHVRVCDLRVSPGAICLGDAVLIELTLENTDTAAHDLTVDYVVHHVRQSGRANPKVFKLARLLLDPGERRRIVKTHPMRRLTTRAYHPGRHRVDIQVNGAILASDGFDLRQDGS